MTSNLSAFGYREFEQLSKIMAGLADSKFPECFDLSAVEIELNDNGMVFLVNSNYNVLALNGENLELFYCLCNSGNEGFKSDLLAEFHGDEAAFKDSLNHHDFNYLQNLEFFD